MDKCKVHKYYKKLHPSRCNKERKHILQLSAFCATLFTAFVFNMFPNKKGIAVDQALARQGSNITARLQSVSA